MTMHLAINLHVSIKPEATFLNDPSRSMIPGQDYRIQLLHIGTRKAMSPFTAVIV